MALFFGGGSCEGSNSSSPRRVKEEIRPFLGNCCGEDVWQVDNSFLRSRVNTLFSTCSRMEVGCCMSIVFSAESAGQLLQHRAMHSCYSRASIVFLDDQLTNLSPRKLSTSRHHHSERSSFDIHLVMIECSWFAHWHMNILMAFYPCNGANDFFKINAFLLTISLCTTRLFFQYITILSSSLCRSIESDKHNIDLGDGTNSHTSVDSNSVEFSSCLALKQQGGGTDEGLPMWLSEADLWSSSEMIWCLREWVLLQFLDVRLEDEYRMLTMKHLLTVHLEQLLIASVAPNTREKCKIQLDHAQAHKGFCYDEYVLVIGSGCNKQWLQLLPIETWELSRISSLYELLPPVYDYVLTNSVLLGVLRTDFLMNICQHHLSIRNNLVDEFRSVICAN
ncbi:hypothetical protein Tco_0752314 [Tanacetum coccineum]|uniref:Uncharacterized protein n=1 Tax=Tanacetum coccineum TaxID=301880 RepID=A0ABQ4ZA29_9ASTR